MVCSEIQRLCMQLREIHLVKLLATLSLFMVGLSVLSSDCCVCWEDACCVGYISMVASQLPAYALYVRCNAYTFNNVRTKCLEKTTNTTKLLAAPKMMLQSSF